MPATKCCRAHASTSQASIEFLEASLKLTRASHYNYNSRKRRLNHHLYAHTASQQIELCDNLRRTTKEIYSKMVALGSPRQLATQLLNFGMAIRDTGAERVDGF